eukprot:g23901.t1
MSRMDAIDAAKPSDAGGKCEHCDGWGFIQAQERAMKARPLKIVVRLMRPSGARRTLKGGRLPGMPPGGLPGLPPEGLSMPR